MGVVSWLKDKFDPDRSADEMGITHVTKLGLTGSRLNKVAEIGKPDAPLWGGDHNAITLPWLDIAKNRDNFDRVDAFQDLMNITQWMEEDKKDAEVSEGIVKANRIDRQCSTLIVGFSMSDPEDMKNIIINKGFMYDPLMGKVPTPVNARLPFPNQKPQEAQG